MSRGALTTILSALIAFAVAAGLWIWRTHREPQPVIAKPPLATVPQPTQTKANDKFDLLTLRENARKAVVTVLNYNANHQLAMTGSGFFISPDGQLVTNKHVIDDAKTAFAKTEDGALYWIAGSFADSASLDLAILKAEAKEVPFLTIQSKEPEVGSRIAVIGSPLALEGTLTEGIVSAIRTDDAGTWIQVTAPISPGSSGSPVLNGENKVVAVATRNSDGR